MFISVQQNETLVYDVTIRLPAAAALFVFVSPGPFFRNTHIGLACKTIFKTKHSAKCDHAKYHKFQCYFVTATLLALPLHPMTPRYSEEANFHCIKQHIASHTYQTKHNYSLKNTHFCATFFILKVWHDRSNTSKAKCTKYSVKDFSSPYLGTKHICNVDRHMASWI